MNVTAFVRQTATAKKKATIYIRVRDNDTKTDIKAATELSINPAYWDADRQGYKSRVTMVRDEERRTLNDAVHDLCRTVSQEYYKGATSDWLKKTIFCFHHPNAYKLTQATVQETRLSKLVEEYISHKDFDKRQATSVRGLVGKIGRFERFQHNVRKKKDYALNVDNFTVDDLEAFQRYLIHENEYYHQYPQLYLGMDKWTVGTKRSDNTLHTVFTRLRTVVRWCVRQGITKNNPFDVFEIPKAIFGTPFFLTIEERDRIWNHDFSDSTHLAMFRDMFVFQCFIGCRFGDLMRLTNGSVIDGVLEYIAHKTMKHDARTIRVPLSKTAMTIYERYRGIPTKSLFPHYNVSDYNKGIREVLRTVGINRIVSVLDPVTRQNVQKPLYEVATLFDALFNYYKVFDQKDKWHETDNPESMELESVWEEYDKKSCGAGCPMDECRYKDLAVRAAMNRDSESSESEEALQMMWQSVCPYYSLDRCKQKQNYFETTCINVTGDIDRLGDEYRRIFKCRNISDRLFGNMLHTIKKPNIQFLMTNYSEEMALRAFRQAKETHREGKAYKDMISRMYYLDDDLKNDTVQFDLAVERFKINCGNIDDNIESILKYVTNTVHELENYCIDNQARSTLHRRFHDLFWNVAEESE